MDSSHSQPAVTSIVTECNSNGYALFDRYDPNMLDPSRLILGIKHQNGHQLDIANIARLQRLLRALFHELRLRQTQCEPPFVVLSFMNLDLMPLARVDQPPSLRRLPQHTLDRLSGRHPAAILLALSPRSGQRLLRDSILFLHLIGRKQPVHHFVFISSAFVRRQILTLHHAEKRLMRPLTVPPVVHHLHSLTAIEVVSNGEDTGSVHKAINIGDPLGDGRGHNALRQRFGDLDVSLSP